MGARRDDEEFADPLEQAPDPAPQPPAQAQTAETLQALEQALAALPPRQRQAFLLRNFEGLDVAIDGTRDGLFRGQREDALFSGAADVARALGGILDMNEDLDPADVEFARRTRALLEDSAASLPARTRSRLTRSRHAALARYSAAGGTRTSAASWQRWLPAGAISAAVLVALLMQGNAAAVSASRCRPARRRPRAATTWSLLADRDALELAQDQDGATTDVDYEFYGWAVGAANDADGGVGT